MSKFQIPKICNILILGDFHLYLKIFKYNIDSYPMNIFTKFQPHISKTDKVTASKVYCCCQPLYWTHVTFLFLVDFFQANNVLWSFFELYAIKEPKNVLHRQTGDLDVWPHGLGQSGHGPTQNQWRGPACLLSHHHTSHPWSWMWSWMGGSSINFKQFWLFRGFKK